MDRVRSKIKEHRNKKATTKWNAGSTSCTCRTIQKPPSAVVTRYLRDTRCELEVAVTSETINALQVEPLVRLNFSTTLRFESVVSRNVEYKITGKYWNSEGAGTAETYSLTTRSLQFMLRAFCSETDLEASKPVSSRTSRT
jgi:hypothetical protein